MSTIKEIFHTNTEFIEFVPGISANLELTELNSSAISAKKQIVNIITKGLWDIVKDENVDNTEAFKSLATAFGNLIMHKALLFDIIANRRSGNDSDVYKYELESMRRQYIDNYYNAMDSLIEEFTSNDNYSDKWKNTREYKLLSNLEIKDTPEFNSYYGIDMSYLFFHRSIPLQREVLLDGLNDTFEKAREDEDLTERLKLALAQLVVALALSRFDIIELPPTIRNLFDDQKSSRAGGDEQNRILSLASDLRANATGIIQAVELALSDHSNPDLVSDTSFNRETDKIYFIS